MDENAELGIYLRVYGGIYLLFLLISGLVPYVLDFRAPSSMGIAAMTVAGMIAAWKFVRDNKRVFTVREKFKMVFFSILVSIAISFGILVVMLFAFGSDSEILRLAPTQMLADISPLAAVIIAGLLLVIYSLVLYFVYGVLTTRLIFRYAQNSQ